MDDRLYWIWMQRAISPGSIKADALLRSFESARAIYEAPPCELRPFGLSGEEIKRISDKSLDTARAILPLALQNDGWVLTPEDGLYPYLLRAIPGIPLVLYGHGELPDLDILPAVSIVGTRNTSAYGMRATSLLAGGLALGGIVVISGGARGVDTIAHQAALAAGGQTIAVQGCGLDINYPSQNFELRQRIMRAGAVVSEFPPGTPPLRHHFPLRNRLISGMALGVCVTEAPKKSGALITARYAFEQGRDVFAVAGDMLSGRSPGTDELIRQGGRLVTGADEILEEYHPRFPDIIDPKAADGVRRDSRFNTKNFGSENGGKSISSPPTSPDSHPSENSRNATCPDSASAEASTLYSLLDGSTKALSELIDASGLSAPQVMTSLTELELSGCVCCLPGQIYSLRTII